MRPAHFSKHCVQLTRLHTPSRLVFFSCVGMALADNTIHPGYHQVMAQPIVISLTDDNFDGIVDDNDIPDIIFSSFSGGSYTSPGTLSAISEKMALCCGARERPMGFSI